VKPGTIDVGGEGPPAKTIRLRKHRVQEILGLPIPRPRQAEILRALEFGVEEAPRGLEVLVPAFRRNDVTREADLIEEVARIDGLEKLPATLPKRRGSAGRLSTEQRLRRRAIDALVGRGMYEIVGWSFTEPGLADRLRLAPDDPPALRGPREPDERGHSVMRTTLLGSLLDAARHNAARGGPTSALFEAGTVYGDQDAKLPHEHRALGGVLAGRLHPQTWGTAEPARAGFFSAKGLLGAALDAVRVPWEVQPATEPFLHPGRSARVLAGGEDVGWVGELHPLVARAWDLDHGAALFELDPRPRARPRRRGPALRRPHELPRAAHGPLAGPGRGRPGRARAGRRAPGGRGAAGRRARLRPLPRRAGGGGAQVARASRSPSARPTAR
jgi:phenylalanyl-tRNA synthetase beta chain